MNEEERSCYNCSHLPVCKFFNMKLDKLPPTSVDPRAANSELAMFFGTLCKSYRDARPDESKFI